MDSSTDKREGRDSPRAFSIPGLPEKVFSMRFSALPRTLHIDEKGIAATFSNEAHE